MKRAKTKYWVIVDCNGRAVFPLDDNGHSDQGMIVHRTRAGAIAQAVHQNEMYDLGAKAVPLGKEKR